MPVVDFIFDDHCPNVDAARANLRAALDAAGFSPKWREHRIGDPSIPEKARGFGSPTILVDGRDLAGVEPNADQCCRIYPTGGGVPPVEIIVRALEQAATREKS